LLSELLTEVLIHWVQRLLLGLASIIWLQQLVRDQTISWDKLDRIRLSYLEANLCQDQVSIHPTLFNHPPVTQSVDVKKTLASVNQRSPRLDCCQMEAMKRLPLRKQLMFQDQTIIRWNMITKMLISVENLAARLVKNAQFLLPYLS